MFFFHLVVRGFPVVTFVFCTTSWISLSPPPPTHPPPPPPLPAVTVNIFSVFRSVWVFFHLLRLHNRHKRREKTQIRKKERKKERREKERREKKTHQEIKRTQPAPWRRGGGGDKIPYVQQHHEFSTQAHNSQAPVPSFLRRMFFFPSVNSFIFLKILLDVYSLC